MPVVTFLIFRVITMYVYQVDCLVIKVTELSISTYRCVYNYGAPVL